MSALIKAGRAIIAAEQNDWELSADQWDYETLERHGVIRQVQAVLMAVRTEMLPWGEFGSAIAFFDEILAEKPE